MFFVHTDYECKFLIKTSKVIFQVICLFDKSLKKAFLHE